MDFDFKWEDKEVIPYVFAVDLSEPSLAERVQFKYYLFYLTSFKAKVHSRRRFRFKNITKGP